MSSVFFLLVMVGNVIQPQACPDERTYTGEYKNVVFGFSIIIPAGLKGYWNSARCAPDEKYGCVCMGDHGRFIPLSDEAAIEVFVGWQMEPEWTLRDHQNNDIAYLKGGRGVKDATVLSSKFTWLGRVRARRFIVQYSENGKAMVVERMIALYKGVEYELTLHTIPQRYRNDRREFDKVVASWKLTPRR